MGSNGRWDEMKPVKRTSSNSFNTARWCHDPNKTVNYEFTFNKKVVTAGTVLKLKHDRTQYRFICLVHDSRLDSTWIELLSVNGYKSARVENISQVLITTKRSRAKKDVD
jgi:hypothetical protein